MGKISLINTVLCKRSSTLDKRPHFFLYSVTIETQYIVSVYYVSVESKQQSNNKTK